MFGSVSRNFPPNYLKNSPELVFVFPLFVYFMHLMESTHTPNSLIMITVGLSFLLPGMPRAWGSIGCRNLSKPKWGIC